jgi:hypothetical protein
MKFMVATPLIAVAVLALVLAWGHTFASQTSAVNVQMDLQVKSGAVACPPASAADFCALKGSTFVLSADLIKAPVTGYIGIQTEIDYGALVYKPTAAAATEIVWADCFFPLRSMSGTLVNHACPTFLPPNPPVISFEVGNLVDITINCTAGNSSNPISLNPFDSGSNTDASGVKLPDASVVPTSDAIVVDCVQAPPTAIPTATNTPPANPQMQKLPALQNLFLTRQGTKIPPLTCAGGNNAATLTESISIPIPTLPDPKDASIDQELGAFEFEVHFDADKVCVNIVPGTAAAGMICFVEDKDSSQLEGVARIGCVTEGKTVFPDTTTTAGRHLADIVVRPQPDEYSVIKPNQDNGNVVQLNNVGCELADLQGHPIAVFSCEDADVTIRFLEGDVEPDCAVNALDTQAIAFRWGANKGSLIYTAFMNLEPSGTQADNDIDIKDLQFVFGRFGSTCKVPWPAQEPINAKA